MQPGYFFGTVIAVTAILVTAMLLMFQWWKKLMTQFLKALETTTNLAASKNLETFQRLQATTNQMSLPESPEPVSPLNDEAAARALAERYNAMGLDPNLAYAKEDVDWRSEFGL